MMNKWMKKIKSIRGNSLAEFAVTTALMGTMATTAAPKLSGVGTGAQKAKSVANIDKIISAASTWFNDHNGIFPGQALYSEQLGSVALAGSWSGGAVESGVFTATEETPDAVDAYVKGDLAATTGSKNANIADWVYCFDKTAPVSDASNLAYTQYATDGGEGGQAAGTDAQTVDDFLEAFGEVGIKSPFIKGGYVYICISGSGEGSTQLAPAIIVADVANPADMHKVFAP